MSDRHRYRNLLAQLCDMEDDQLVNLEQAVGVELRKRRLDAERLADEEAKRRLGIFLELDAGYTFDFYRVTGRTVWPKQGFAPLLAQTPPASAGLWHLVEPDTGRGITFPVRRDAIKLACMGAPVLVADHTIHYRTGLTNCPRCYGSGKIVVAVSRPLPHVHVAPEGKIVAPE